MKPGRFHRVLRDICSWRCPATGAKPVKLRLNVRPALITGGKEDIFEGRIRVKRRRIRHPDAIGLELSPCYVLAAGVKQDPVRHWLLPERVFFACGACHILAYAFLKAYPRSGLAPLWIKPSKGFTGNHIVVVRRYGLRLSWFFKLEPFA